MEKTANPPAYNEIYPTAPPIEPNMYQQTYPNVPPQNIYPQLGYQQPMIQVQPLQAPQPRTNVIIINQQVIFGENPVVMTCPNCQQQTVTKIQHSSNIINHVIAGALCVLGLWCCVCIPYCVDSIKDVNHTCGKCNSFLGTYRRGRV